MGIYEELFAAHDLGVAQILLTHADLEHHERHLNARNTLITLLRKGVIPVINENDVVSFTELKFGDNDKLSALVMTHAGADLLVLLSDVDGLYDGDPQNPGAKLIEELDGVTDAVRAFAQGGNGRGRGGMESKLEAARIANEAGQPAVIANGRTPGVIDMICSGMNIGSLFAAKQGKAAGKRA